MRDDWELVKKQLWDKNLEYHRLTSNGISEGIKKGHPGLRKIQKLSLKANNIFDGGCGGGALLNLIYKKGKRYTGVDVSNLAISQAQKRLKGRTNVELMVANLEKLPFSDGQFDLSYSVYVLEHLKNPQKAIEEIIRVTIVGGKIVFLCPNFGCPHWSSPDNNPRLDHLLIRGAKLFIKSYIQLFSKRQNYIKWEHAYPLILEKKGHVYETDWDTVSEPYLGSLLLFLKGKKVKILEYNSGWNWQEEKGAVNNFPGLFQTVRNLFKILGESGVPPYKYYGPILFVVGEKE